MSEYIYETDGKPMRDANGNVSLARLRIVRCRDCMNYEPNDYIHFTCEYLQHWVESDDYCAWGERKERIES